MRQASFAIRKSRAAVKVRIEHFGEGCGGLFENPVLVEIGQAHGKTAAQAMLRWNLQRGVVGLFRNRCARRAGESLAKAFG